jgi:ATP-dependent DNA helicase RecG
MSAVFTEVKTVKEEYEKLSQKIFPDLKIAMLHGRMKPKEKEKIMSAFANLPAGKAGVSADKKEKIDILVSTSVVEVGVDVPNASIMMIEGSERFGLAQLYQLRGRVGRGEHQSFCFLFTDLPVGRQGSDSKATSDRLKAILEAKNGFELAEKDLKLRGPGEFIGQKQTGLPDIAMRGLQDIELIKQSRTAALKLIQNDSSLKKHPLLAERLGEFKQKIHPE